MTTLGSALNLSFAGIRNTEARISTTSANVTNADLEGYTRKTFQNDSFTTNSGTYPIGGEIVSTILNPFLQEQLINDTSLAERGETIHRFLSQYADRLGSTDGKNTLNASLDDFAAALEQVYVSPEDSGLKFQVVSAAQRLAQNLNDLSGNVQNLRRQADTEIDQTVDRINNTVQLIHDLNGAIAMSASTGVSTADLEDQQRTAIMKLSEDIDIQYFSYNENQIQIYAAGQPLLVSVPRPLNYTPTNFVNSTVTYPGGFSNLEIGGIDITTTLTSGKLSALVELRDTTFVEEQDKLSELAIVIEREVNAISNQGASYPAPAVMTGDEDTATLPAIAGATGFVRIATTDSNGVVTSFTDFDVSAFGTVAGMVGVINGAGGLDVTASIDPDGKLVLTADNAGEGVALNDNQMAGGATDMDGIGTGFGQFFGMNNIFYSETLGAEDILVSPTLLLDSNHLPTSRLDPNVAMVVGDVGVNPGDGTITDELNDILTASTNFALAGNFAAQSNTIDNYTDIIMSDLASRSASARSSADVSTLAAKKTKETLENLQGVNINEEMTYLLDLESKYQAASALLGKIQEMLQELINAVR